MANIVDTGDYVITKYGEYVYRNQRHSPWWQDPKRFIEPKDLVPGHYIAIMLGNGMYSMRVARVEPLTDGKIRIKAGVCTYTYWFCYWYHLDKDEKIWLLGPG